MINEDLNRRMDKSIIAAKLKATQMFNKNARDVTVFVVTKTVILEFLRIYFLGFGLINKKKGFRNAVYEALEKAMELTYLWELQNPSKRRLIEE